VQFSRFQSLRIWMSAKSKFSRTTWLQHDANPFGPISFACWISWFQDDKVLLLPSKARCGSNVSPDPLDNIGWEIYGIRDDDSNTFQLRAQDLVQSDFKTVFFRRHVFLHSVCTERDMIRIFVPQKRRRCSRANVINTTRPVPISRIRHPAEAGITN